MRWINESSLTADPQHRDQLPPHRRGQARRRPSGSSYLPHRRDAPRSGESTNGTTTTDWMDQEPEAGDHDHQLPAITCQCGATRSTSSTRPGHVDCPRPKWSGACGSWTGALASWTLGEREPQSEVVWASGRPLPRASHRLREQDGSSGGGLRGGPRRHAGDAGRIADRPVLPGSRGGFSVTASSTS